MALMEKSRRAKSCSIVPQLLSRKIIPCAEVMAFFGGARNVATSINSRPEYTCANSKRRPIIRQRRPNTSFTCEGVALVTAS